MLFLVLKLLLIRLCISGVFIYPLAFLDNPFVIELYQVLLGLSQLSHLLLVELFLIRAEFLERPLQPLFNLLFVVLVELVLGLVLLALLVVCVL